MFAPSRKAGHMGATDQLFVTNQKVLANGMPSTHGMDMIMKTERRADGAAVRSIWHAHGMILRQRK